MVLRAQKAKHAVCSSAELAFHRPLLLLLLLVLVLGKSKKKKQARQAAKKDRRGWGKKKNKALRQSQARRPAHLSSASPSSHSWMALGASCGASIICTLFLSVAMSTMYVVSAKW